MLPKAPYNARHVPCSKYLSNTQENIVSILYSSRYLRDNACIVCTLLIHDKDNMSYATLGDTSLWTDTRALLDEFVASLEDDNLDSYAANCLNAGYKYPGYERPVYARTVGDRLMCRLMTGALYFMNGWGPGSSSAAPTDPTNEALKEYIRCAIVNVFMYILLESPCRSRMGIHNAWYTMKQLEDGPGRGLITTSKCGQGVFQNIQTQNFDMGTEIKGWLENNKSLTQKFAGPRIQRICTTTLEDLDGVKPGTYKMGDQIEMQPEEIDAIRQLGKGVKTLVEEVKKGVEQCERDYGKCMESIQHVSSSDRDDEASTTPAVPPTTVPAEPKKAVPEETKPETGVGKKAAEASHQRGASGSTTPVTGTPRSETPPQGAGQGPGPGQQPPPPSPPRAEPTDPSKGQKDEEKARKCPKTPEASTVKNAGKGLAGASSTTTITFGTSSGAEDACDKTTKDSGPGSLLSTANTPDTTDNGAADSPQAPAPAPAPAPPAAPAGGDSSGKDQSSGGTSTDQVADNKVKCTQGPQVFKETNTGMGISGATSSIVLSFAPTSENDDDCDKKPDDTGAGSVLREHPTGQESKQQKMQPQFPATQGETPRRERNQTSNENERKSDRSAAGHQDVTPVTQRTNQEGSGVQPGQEPVPASSGPGSTGDQHPGSSGSGSTSAGTGTTEGSGAAGTGGNGRDTGSQGDFSGLSLNDPGIFKDGNPGGGMAPPTLDAGTSKNPIEYPGTPRNPNSGPHAPDLTGDILTATTPILFFLTSVTVALLAPAGGDSSGKDQSSGGTSTDQVADNKVKCTQGPQVFKETNTGMGISGATSSIVLSFAPTSENDDDCDKKPDDTGAGSVLREHPTGQESKQQKMQPQFPATQGETPRRERNQTSNENERKSDRSAAGHQDVTPVTQRTNQEGSGVQPGQEPVPASSGPGSTGDQHPGSSGSGSTSAGTGTTEGSGAAGTGGNGRDTGSQGDFSGLSLNDPGIFKDGNPGGGMAPPTLDAGTSKNPIEYPGTPRNPNSGPHAPDLTGDILTATTPILFFLTSVTVALLGYSLWKANTLGTSSGNVTSEYGTEVGTAAASTIATTTVSLSDATDVGKRGQRNFYDGQSTSRRMKNTVFGNVCKGLKSKMQANRSRQTKNKPQGGTAGSSCRRGLKKWTRCKMGKKAWSILIVVSTVLYSFLVPTMQDYMSYGSYTIADYFSGLASMHGIPMLIPIIYACVLVCFCCSKTGKCLFDKMWKKKKKEEGPTETKNNEGEVNKKPDTPGKQKVPGKPEVPNKQEASGILEVPKKRETPGKSDVPQKQETPKKPEVSNKTEVPGKTKVPKKPEVPGQSQVPHKPEVLVKPQSCGKSEVPKKAEVPKKSEAPAKIKLPWKLKLPGKP
ncbi:hypothetical protein AK88_05250 [Plasmodium fragile]|uniref:Schizont-infected cell agglutination extracellular alpha domain-containing protein n=1 Tax=Plasmodium fragile TaxID=5857 RepID=A0A0D9QDL0_PLAFR|nr:uncharacterized protein AK88_05250 [Plasmodium fragile]KJP85125.1 hypothetical protein AK88_05250 [Plasmodium fragile]